MVIRWIALGALGILALIGGVTLTRFVRFVIRENRAERVARQCMPCTCGHDDIGVHVTDDGAPVAIECLHCNRVVAGKDIVERWNKGEADNVEIDNYYA